jgi:hypothetical protein
MRVYFIRAATHRWRSAQRYKSNHVHQNRDNIDNAMRIFYLYL